MENEDNSEKILFSQSKIYKIFLQSKQIKQITSRKNAKT